MRRVDRKALRAPARVADLELVSVNETCEDTLAVEDYDSIWCLSRINRIPQRISFWDVTKDTVISISDLRRQLCAEVVIDHEVSLEAYAPNAISSDMTVVVCTRDRPEGLRATLSSLQHQTDSDFSILVVDNGCGSSGNVDKELDLPRCEYTVEPRPGLARARNRALKTICTDLVAWIDDDEAADADWVRRLKEGFAHQAKPAAVCGVMLPAELEYEAQVRFEQYGGFSKGRGMLPEVLRMGTSSVVSPLYPLPAFGNGGNMAFRTEDLHSVGGFDPYLGAGTRTHGGEETRVLSSLLSSGSSVLHWPAAITWHTHRREMTALRRQFYGYSAGLSAFYASIIHSKPTLALDVARLAPHMLRDLRPGSSNLRSGQLPDDFPAYLLRAARRGLIEGGLMYMYEMLRDRPQAISAIQKGVYNDAARS